MGREERGKCKHIFGRRHVRRFSEKLAAKVILKMSFMSAFLENPIVFYITYREELSQWPILDAAEMELNQACAVSVQDTMNDEMLAQLLQLQFDQEYDRALGKEEAKYNGTSKGTSILSSSCLYPLLKLVIGILSKWLFPCPIIVRFPKGVYWMKIQIHLMMTNGIKPTKVGTVLK